MPAGDGPERARPRPSLPPPRPASAPRAARPFHTPLARRSAPRRSPRPPTGPRATSPVSRVPRPAPGRWSAVPLVAQLKLGWRVAPARLSPGRRRFRLASRGARHRTLALPGPPSEDGLPPSHRQCPGRGPEDDRGGERDRHPPLRVRRRPSRGYDCSGSVSLSPARRGAPELARDSTEPESYGKPERGRYVTIYANSGHAVMTIYGRRFDTGA